MRYLISGSRSWTDRAKINEHITEMDCLFDVLIHGSCPYGADRIADELAQDYGIERMPFPANWKWYGKSAGRIRNELMITEGKPDWAFCFWDGESPGTRNMIKLLLDYKIQHEVIAATGTKDRVMLEYRNIVDGYPRQGRLEHT